MSKKKRLTVQEGGDICIDYTTVEHAIALLKEYPMDAMVDFGCSEITWNRLETDEEYETRLAYEKKRDEAQKVQDERLAKTVEKEQYATYLILKQRFEK